MLRYELLPKSDYPLTKFVRRVLERSFHARQLLTFSTEPLVIDHGPLGISGRGHRWCRGDGLSHRVPGGHRS